MQWIDCHLADEYLAIDEAGRVVAEVSLAQFSNCYWYARVWPKPEDEAKGLGHYLSAGTAKQACELALQPKAVPHA